MPEGAGHGWENGFGEFVNHRKFARCCGSQTRAPGHGQHALDAVLVYDSDGELRRPYRRAQRQATEPPVQGLSKVVRLWLFVPPGYGVKLHPRQRRANFRPFFLRTMA